MMKQSMLYGLFFAAFVMVFASCTSEEPDKVAADDRKKILEYIRDKGLEDEAIEHESGLFYVMDDPGTGNHPKLDSWIRISYTGKFLDDEVFEYREGDLIQLQNMMRGWREGLPLFKNGGEGILIFPSALGYGAYPPYHSGIPRNACLVFHFNIIDIGS